MWMHFLENVCKLYESRKTRKKKYNSCFSQQVLEMLSKEKKVSYAQAIDQGGGDCSSVWNLSVSTIWDTLFSPSIYTLPHLVLYFIERILWRQNLVQVGSRLKISTDSLRGVIVYLWSTRVSVPSSELCPPSPARECVSPLDPNLWGQHSLAGEGVGGPY